MVFVKVSLGLESGENEYKATMVMFCIGIHTTRYERAQQSWYYIEDTRAAGHSIEGRFIS